MDDQATDSTETRDPTSTVQPSAAAGVPDRMQTDRMQTGERSGETMEQAKAMARNVGEQARAVAGSAQEIARRVREQTGSATGALYDQGARAGEYMTRSVNEYPLAALLVAGAIGYGVGYLLHGNWSGRTAETGGDAAHSDERHQRDARRDRRD